MFLQKSHIGKFCPRDMVSANQILISDISRIVKEPDFLQVDTNSHKLKVDQKMFGWTWSKIVVASLVMGR